MPSQPIPLSSFLRPRHSGFPRRTFRGDSEGNRGGIFSHKQQGEVVGCQPGGCLLRVRYFPAELEGARGHYRGLIFQPGFRRMIPPRRVCRRTWHLFYPTAVCPLSKREVRASGPETEICPLFFVPRFRTTGKQSIMKADREFFFSRYVDCEVLGSTGRRNSITRPADNNKRQSD